MSMLDPARAGLDAFIAALEAKEAATPALLDAFAHSVPSDKDPVPITRGDLKQMIAALKVGQTELAAVQLPFGM